MLREPAFRKHAPHFVTSWRSQDDSSHLVDYICQRIPAHLQSLHWRELLGKPVLAGQLVLHESRLKEVLAKFERTEFIHT